MDQQGQPVFGGQGYVNPGGGLVFTSEGVRDKKGGKKTLIIVGVLLVVIVIAVVALFMFGGGGGSIFSPTKLQGFSELRTFIEDGDEETRALFSGSEKTSESGTEGGESDELIMAVRIAEKGETEVRKYYEKLEVLEQNFYDKSGLTVDAELLAEYGNALKILKNAINHYKTKEGLIEAYEQGGESGAEVYLGENVECNGGSEGKLRVLCDSEEKYYSIIKDRHGVFADAGCYVGGECDYNCANSFYNNAENSLEVLLVRVGNPDAQLSIMHDRMLLLKMSEEIVKQNDSLEQGDRL